MKFTKLQYAAMLLPPVPLLLILAWNSELIPALFITCWAVVATYAGIEALLAAWRGRVALKRI